MLRKTLSYLKKLIKGEMSWNNVWYFIQGHVREKLYYSKFKFLIRKHIREQFEFRLEVMNKDCYNSGQCKICGCDIPALTLSDKSCEGNCYPKMKSKKNWEKVKNK